MKEIKVTVINEFGEKLVGLETTPLTGKERYPAVVLVHGFGVTKEESGMFDNLAKNLSEAGFLVYRFDFSGCGESEGDYSETSLTKLKSDLSSILEFVQSQPQVDSSRIGILGQSFGGLTSIILEPKVRCFIIMSAPSSPKENLKKFFGEGFNPEEISKVSRSSGQITRVKPQFWKDLKKYNPLESIKNIHCPILFIHGKKDDKVPISEMEAYYENANKPKEKIIVEGADHELRSHREKMYKIIVNWFKKQLNPNRF